MMLGPDQNRSERVSTDQDVQDRVRMAADVFGRYEKDIRAFIDYHVRDRAQADDLFQDFFLSLVVTPLPRDLSSVRRYLYRAITNDVVSMARRRKSYRRSTEVYAEDRKRRDLDDDPSRRLMKAEETQKMLAIIQRHLRPTEAEAVMSRYLLERDTAEAADHMGVHPRSVARYVCQGLRKIRSVAINPEEATAG